MVKFTHYLVTRFNVPVENWHRDKEGQTTLDDAWMKHRLSLFRQYCVPTIANQSCKNFQWIIYCDKALSPQHENEILECVHQLENVSIRKASHHQDMVADLRQYISRSTTPYIITTRLDNDDGMGADLIRNIQAAFSEKDKLLLNPLNGIIYDMHLKVMTQMKKSERNHYSSLIEKNKSPGELLTVLGFAHTDPPNEITVLNMTEPRAWLKIIHEKNIVSRLKGKPLWLKRDIYFEGIPGSAFSFSFSNAAMYGIRRVIQKINR